MQRRFIAEHLPFCPASVVICNAEWNRWALGAKERERVAMTKGITALYNPMDLGQVIHKSVSCCIHMMFIAT